MPKDQTLILPFIILFFLNGNLLSAQESKNNKSDSLFTLLEFATNDSNKVDLYLELFKATRSYKSDKSINYAKNGLELAKKINYAKGEIQSYLCIGGYYADIADNTKGYRYFLKGLKLAENSNYPLLQARLERGIAFVYNVQEQPEKSLSMIKSAIGHFQEAGDKTQEAITYTAYYEMQMKQGHRKDALEKLKYGMKLINSTNDDYAKARLSMTMTTAMIEENNLDSAEKYSKDAIKLCSKLLNHRDKAYNLVLLSEIYLKKNNPKQSLIFADSALSICEENNLVKEKMDSYQQLELVYLALEDYKNAYLFNSLKQEIINSTQNTSSIAEIVNLETKYKQDKIDAVTKLEIDNQRMLLKVAIIGLVLLLGFSVILFFQRKKISKEKKRSEELLLNILPPETAAELQKSGTTTAKDFNEVTIMFTDFKNFTAISKNMSAQELVNEINLYYTKFDKIISSYGIEKIKTIGDSYMCAGGLPVANKTNAIDVVNAAIEIRDFVEKEKQNKMSKSEPYFEIRIGCNTGSVVAGIVGIKKFAYDIWGTSVNLASRMEQHCEEGKVNVSQSTYNVIKDSFECNYRGEIEAKNVGMTKMYYVEQLES